MMHETEMQPVHDDRFDLAPDGFGYQSQCECGWRGHIWRPADFMVSGDAEFEGAEMAERAALVEGAAHEVLELA